MSIQKIFDCVFKKSRQGVCSENFSSVAWRMAKLEYYVAQWSKRSKVNSKQIWQLCFEKDQARVLWWKFKLSSMKNGKVSIYDVAQWSKMVKSQFEKFWPLCFGKDQARGLWWKFQLCGMKNGKVSIYDVAQWSKMVKSQCEKKFTTVFWKRSGKVCMEKISAL